MDKKAFTKVVKSVGGNLVPDNKTHKNRINIRSASSNRIYTVSQRKSNDKWECSCPGWVFKRAGKERSCKHLKAMLPELETSKKEIEITR